MTDETGRQIALKGSGSSLVLSTARSDLVARGRRAAAALAADADSEAPLSLEEIQRLAEKGNAAAQWALSGMYYGGTGGVAQNYAEGIKWHRKVAEQGIADAQCTLGDVYARKVAPPDYAEAVRWYRMAAELGDSVAQTHLAYMYWSGQGVRQDYAEAAQWYRKAAEKGVAQAQYALGYMYENGQGVSQELVQAYLWISLAASRAAGDDQKKFANAAGMIAEKMSPAQIGKAQRLARAWRVGAGECPIEGE